MSKYIEVMLPDLPLDKGEVSYFDENPEDLKKLNNKEFVIIPMSVYSDVRSRVIVIHRNFFDSLPEEKLIRVLETNEGVKEESKPKKARIKKVESN